MTHYPPLVANSCVAYPEIIAFENHTDSIRYGELSAECAALCARWRPLHPRRVGLWVDNSLKSFIALHALNWMGSVVVCLRKRDGGSEADLLESCSIDHVVNTESLTLVPCGSEGPATQACERVWTWSAAQFELQSSGTTGEPKWLPLTTRQLILSAFGSAIRLGHLPGDQWLNVLAPGHMGWLAVLVRCALYGTTVRVRPFERDNLVPLLESGSITQISLVPSMLSDLVAHAPNALQRVRTVLVGGGPTNAALLQECRDKGVHVHASWGMTEAGSQVATQVSGALNTNGHVGPPMPFVDISERSGHLHLSGPLLNAPLTTQDLGTVDESGNITVLGRADDVILTSGHKIHPQEIESVFDRIAGVNICCAVGLPHSKWGNVVALVLESKHTAELVDVLGNAVAGIRMTPSPRKPRRLFVVDSIPTNAMKKVQRPLLVQLLLQFDQMMGAEPVQQHLGQGHRLEGPQIDGSVGQSDCGTNTSRLIDDIVAKGESAGAHVYNPDFNGQFFTLTQRDFEVTLGANEGQTNRMFVKELIPVAEDRKQKLFESGVCIFEDTAEENDTCAVNLVESRFKAVTKSHEVNLLSRKEKVKI